MHQTLKFNYSINNFLSFQNWQITLPQSWLKKLQTSVKPRMCGPWAVFSLTWPLPPSWRRKRPSPDWGKSERTPTNWRKCLKMLPRYDLLFITEKGYISLQWPGASFSDFSKTFFMGRSPKWAILLSYTCKCNSLYLTYYKSILL